MTIMTYILKVLEWFVEMEKRPHKKSVVDDLPRIVLRVNTNSMPTVVREAQYLFGKYQFKLDPWIVISDKTSNEEKSDFDDPLIEIVIGAGISAIVGYAVKWFIDVLRHHKEKEKGFEAVVVSKSLALAKSQAMQDVEQNYHLSPKHYKVTEAVRRGNNFFVSVTENRLHQRHQYLISRTCELKEYRLKNSKRPS